MNVLIADDCTLTREGIKSLLTPERDIIVAAEAEDGEKAIKLVKELKPDIILLSLKLPKINGLEVIRRTRGLCKAVAVAVRGDMAEVGQAGGAGCLPRNMAAQALADALRRVKNGETLLPPGVRYKEPPTAADGKKPLLTLRELEILQLISQGMDNKSIARELYLSEKTVKNHLTNIFKKLKVTDRTQALLFALKQRLVIL